MVAIDLSSIRSFSELHKTVRPNYHSSKKTIIAQHLAIATTTHNLFDEERDPVLMECAKLGLENASGSRVKVVRADAATLVVEAV